MTKFCLILFLFIFSGSCFAENPWCNFFIDKEKIQIINETKSKANVLYEKRKDKVQIVKKIDGGMDRADIHILTGVPSNIQIVTAEELGVVRHYSPNVQEIIDSGVLRAGPREYWNVDAHLVEQYYDLSGINFTTTEFKASALWMGLDETSPYVDFILPPGTGIIKIKEGHYIIPGQKKYHDWLIKAYRSYKETNNPNGMKDTFDLIDSLGGIGSPLEVPIKIVNFKK